MKAATVQAMGLRIPERFHPVTHETEEAVTRWDIGRTVHRAMERHLTPREEHIIRMRFGIGHPRNIEMTYQEISDACGVSKARIQQILYKAMRKLRHPSRGGRELRALHGEQRAVDFNSYSVLPFVQPDWRAYAPLPKPTGQPAPRFRYLQEEVDRLPPEFVAFGEAFWQQVEEEAMKFVLR